MLTYGLYAFGAFLVRILPHRLSHIAARSIADLHFLFRPANRRAIESNLRQVLGPGAAESEVRRTARRVFRNFAGLVVDFLRLPQLGRGDLSREVRIQGWKNLARARARGRGVVLLGAHLGSWELGGAVLSRLGVPVVAVARDHAHPRVTRFFNKRREAAGMRVMGPSGTARDAIGVLRRGGVLALLGDRDPLCSGLPVRFFGRTARLPRSPVTLALRTGAAILPAVAVRRQGGILEVIIRKPIFVGAAAGRSGLEQGVRRCAAALEKPIRRDLEQWFAFEPLWDPAGAPARPS